MKRLWLLAILLFLTTGCNPFASAPFSATQAPPSPTNMNPQNVKMAWMQGPGLNDQQGVYGTQGVPSASNFPGARTWFASCSDSLGNLWVFGGEGHAGGSWGDLNDLWMFSPTIRQWTWKGGSNTVGPATSATSPGGRRGPVAWCDLSGDVWIFGGNNGNYLNELWEYVSSSGQWKMISTATPPPARMWAVSWTDSAGDLWLFGGQGITSTGQGILNDLWKYSVSQNAWTQVSGSTSPSMAGVYGTLGVPSANNSPGGRRFPMGWADSKGNLWLFGGDGADGSGKIQILNDLWKFSTATKMWTWVSGSNQADPIGFYGYPGVATRQNSPGGRFGSYTWIDKSDNLWMFGGQGNDITGNPNINALNDLWVFSPGSGNWVWMGGSNTGDHPGEYGTQGILSTSNVPSSRKFGAASADPSGNFWLFGGQGYDVNGSYAPLSDIWEIQVHQ